MLLKIIESTKWRRAKRIGLYSSIPTEIQTDRLIKAALRREKQVSLPRIRSDAMQFHVITHFGGVRPGNFGIMEPIRGSIGDPELVIVPGVAFDKTGRRLGHGKGYYDRWIAERNPRPFLIGICLEEQLVPEVPVEDHDIAMDALCVAGTWVKPPPGYIAFKERLRGY